MNALNILRSGKRDPSVIAASFAANLLALALPIAMLQIFDRVIPNQGYATLAFLALMIALSLLLDGLLRMARSQLLNKSAAEFEICANAQAYWTLLMEDCAQQERMSPAMIRNRLSAIERLRGQHAGSATNALLDLPFAILFTFVIYLISPMAALAISIVLAISFMLLRYARHALVAPRQERAEVEARRQSFLLEALQGINTIHALRIGGIMQRRYDRLLGHSAERTVKINRGILSAQGLTAAIGNLAPVVAAVAAGWQVLQEDATIGMLAAVIVLSGRVVQPVLRVEAFLSSLENARIAEQDFNALQSRPLRQSGSTPLTQVQQLEFSGVATKADPATGLAFSDFSLDLCQGDCLLLNGESRAQFDLMIRLLLGELPLKSGRVEINGKDLSSYQLRDVIERLRLISSENRLLAGSLADNICGFRTDLNMDYALSLSAELGLQRMLEQSSDGLETEIRVGGGCALPISAMRVASNIAGLVTKPDLVIFDQANSGLDHALDRQMLAWLQRNRSDHILVLISDRPSYQKLANKRLDLGDHITSETALSAEKQEASK